MHPGLLLALAVLAAEAKPRRGEAGGETRQVHTVRSTGGTDAPMAIAHDSRGNVLTLGNHRTPVDFGRGPIGSPSGASVLTLSKHSPEGGLL